MTGCNPTDKSKLGQAKRRFNRQEWNSTFCIIRQQALWRYKSSNKDVIDNTVVIKQPMPFLSIIKRKRRKHYPHLCLDREHIVLKQKDSK